MEVASKIREYCGPQPSLLDKLLVFEMCGVPEDLSELFLVSINTLYAPPKES